MILDLAAISGVIALALSTLNLFGLVRNMLSSGERKLDERVGKVETKLVDHDRRIQKAENDIAHLPNRESLHNMELRMAEISGRLQVLNESLKPIRENNEMISDLLRKQVTRNG